MTLQNDRFIKALFKQPVDRTPIWIMRQAGRYLPEYREVRKQAGDFLTLCKTPELACEVTMQPLRRFDFDASIIFSDILTIPDAMGLGLHFVTGEGPKFSNPLRSTQAIKELNIPNSEDQLHYVADAIRLTRKTINGKVPLIGFSGSPWTLSTYMVEGGGSKQFSKVKALMYSEPKAFELLLDKLTESVTEYLNMQVKAGAQALMIFDTWGGLLTPEGYIQYSLNPMKKIISGLIREHEGAKIPVIMFTKNGGQWLEVIAESGADGVGLDWTTDIANAYQRIGDKVALQGNMDPALLHAPVDVIEQTVKKILAGVPNHTGHVFNLGHGITPDVEPAKVEFLVNCVHELGVKS